MNEEQNQPERISSKYLDAADKYNLTDAELRDYLSYEGLADDEFTAIMQERGLRAQDKAKQEQAMVEERISQIETEMEGIEEQPQQEGAEGLRVGILGSLAAGATEAFGKMEAGYLDALNYLGFETSVASTLATPSISGMVNPKLRFMGALGLDQRRLFLRGEVDRIMQEYTTELQGTEGVDALDYITGNLNPFNEDGNIIDGLHYGFSQVAYSFPNMVIASTGYGTALLGGSEAMSAYAEVRDNKDMSQAEKFGYSVIAGSIEAASERISGKIFGKALKGASAADKLLSRQFTKGLLKSVGLGATEEAVAEFAAGFLQSANRQGFLSDDKMNYNQAIREGLTGAIIGSLGGGTFGASGYTIGSIVKSSGGLDEKVSELEKRRNELISSLNETTDPVERQSIHRSIEEVDTLYGELNNRRSERYRVMRRRNPEALERLSMRAAMIQSAKARYQNSKSESEKKAIKESLEGLINEFKEIDAAAIEEGATLTLTERLEDSMDDINIAIRESEADLEAVADMEFTSDADLLAVRGVMDRVSSLKSLKKQLMKASGEVDAAMRSGDAAALAKAEASLDELLGDALPSEAAPYTTIEQAEDDLGQDSSSETTTEQEQPTNGYEAFTFTSESQVGEEFAEEVRGTDVNFGMRGVINNLLSSFSNLGLSVVWHKTNESFEAARGGENAAQSEAFYDKKNKQIHLRPNANAAQIRHEFAHGAFRSLFDNKQTRQRLVKEIEALIQNDPDAQRLYNEVAKAYEGRGEATVEEEIIVKFLEQLTRPDIYEKLNRKGFVQKIIDVINRLIGSKFGVKDSMLITDASEFREVVNALKFAVDTGNSVDVQGVANETSSGFMDMKSKAYPDLVNKTVYFAVYSPTYSGVSRPSYREVNVNDYFHWRNFWASMTGNGRKDWIKDVYYIGDDGKQKRIKTPTPKKDRRTGEVLEMPAKLKSSHQWKMEQAERERKAAIEQRRREAFAFTSMYETEREGIDVNELDDEAFTAVEDRSAISDDFVFDSIEGIEPLYKSKGGVKITTDVKAGFKKGDTKDLVGIPAANAPYDQSSAKNKRLSGIGNLSWPKDSSKYVVFAVSEEGMDQDMYDAIIAAVKRGDEKFVITHTAMSEDALIANESVFIEYFLDIENKLVSMKDKYSPENGFKEGEFDVIVGEFQRGLMEIANEFVTASNLSRKKRRRITSVMQDFDSYDSETGTISNPNDVFSFIGSMSNALTFEERRALVKKVKKTGELESKIETAYTNVDPTKKVAFNIEEAIKEELKTIFPDISKYKDPAFADVPVDAIIAAKVISLKNGSGVRLEESPNSPFPYVVTVPKENVELLYFDEAYSFYDAYGSYKLRDGRTVSDILNELKDQGISQKRRESLVGTKTKVNVTPTYLAQGIFSTDRTASDEKMESLVDVSELEVDSFNPREQGSFDSIMTRLKVKFQDRFARVMMLQEDIERFRGKSVSESQDFKMSEELMHGKTKDDLDKLQVRVEAIAEDMKTGEFSSDDVSQYIYAKHAKERNRVIFERTEGKVENGSGMSDAEADQILNSYEGKNKDQMEAISSKVQEIVADTRRTYVELGLENQEAIDAFESMFENYVPLSGIAIDEETAETSSYPTGGGGLAIYGSPTKRAKGRKTQAQNILAQVVAQNAQAKVRGRKNEALNTLYNLVQDNPNSKVWRITDTVKYESDNAVGIRVNGQQKYIVFRDASMAKSLKNMGVEKLDFFSKLLRTPAVWLRRSFTTANPEFVISNFARDIQSSIFNALAEAEIEGGMIQGKEVAVKIISRTKQTLPALVKSSFGKSLDAETQRYLDEFREDGGQTGWGYVKPVSEIAAEIEAMTDETSKLNKAAQWMSKNSIEVVENVNDAFENSIRLSAYIEARQAGASRAKAAQLAKNITVNFNKHGELGPVFNAWYLFFNASVQGTARLGRSLTNLKPKYEPFAGKRTGLHRMTSAQKLAFGLTTLSSMMAMINISLSDEDEDGELFYNKIPDYEKERNLIMMYDGKHYIKIPLPYGFNLFANVGTAIAETSTGNREAVDAMSFIAMSAFSSFSPISFGQSKDMFTYIGKAFVPTVLKPIAEIAINETYFGGSVYREQFPVGAPKPEYQMAFKSPKAVQDFFEWMNEATGGNEFESGWIDSNPDKFWHIFDYALGGAGQFVTRTADFLHGMGAMAVEGEKMKMEANDIPFLRKLYGDPSKYYDYQLYSDRKEEIQQLYRAVKGGDVDRKLDRYKAVIPLDKRIKTVEKKLKKLRQDRKKAKELPYLQRQNALAEIFEKERSLVMDFNKYYDERRK